MSIERTQSSQTDATERSDKPRDTDKTPPLRENVDRFKALMQQGKAKGEGEDGKAKLLREGLVSKGDEANANAVAERGLAKNDANDADSLRRRRDEHGLSSHALQQADASQMFQAQQAVRGDVMPQTHTPVNPTAFADMVERHVRQLAIGRHSGDASGDGQVLLRMADSTLPGTDLLLSRTADGWMLRADVRSRNSYDAIKDAAPELAKRFAERNLGILSIDPHFHA